ncbi:MAG: hypothetical protein B1H07_00120 [Campylobacteraceae bacterium 4484_166]|nr:MAG: hypothetical protein B1H07_00120 [Campylobacteraceae bacterium 4484_166]
MLILYGIVVGFLAGFFGVGGGMVLVPILLYSGYVIKEAISISIVQMFFSSIFGSIISFKHFKLKLKYALTVGLGGFVGAINSALVVSYLDETVLQYLFVVVVLVSIFIVVFKKQKYETNKEKNLLWLFVVSMFIGLFFISLGIGGAILLTPFLMLYLNIDLKLSSSYGLFFVMFSSTAGLISQYLYLDFLSLDGVVIGLSSLVGVYVGVTIKKSLDIKKFGNYIIFLYIFVLIAMIFKLNMG